MLRLIVARYEVNGPAGALVAKPSRRANDCSGSCITDLPDSKGLPKPQVGTHASISSQPGNCQYVTALSRQHDEITYFVWGHLKPLKPCLDSFTMVTCRVIGFFERVLFVRPVTPGPLMSNCGEDGQRMRSIVGVCSCARILIPLLESGYLSLCIPSGMCRRIVLEEYPACCEDTIP